MPQSLSKVYVHLAFSTKNRELFITSEVQNRLFQYLGGICAGLDCTPIQIEGYKDHVHLL
ncbi:MAG: transposase [Prolixibacteraceae bacterium]|nr:transposase [Prolixibacteraceae bacterium]